MSSTRLKGPSPLLSGGCQPGTEPRLGHEELPMLAALASHCRCLSVLLQPVPFPVPEHGPCLSTLPSQKAKSKGCTLLLP